ncbi:hypothetical protein BT96DRAFT_951526 [Gymnopus androsaceus JB14]|uniref:Uncharacterized protein n=1 Tax=Gymnopus androsaceus JB14 TaxID=1447944 RepID=A0A6A4GCH2_9AGAR|nr:hypothetical protein BT96DRAFT_951526 [Gymnopus androsaceus JB14]
MAQRFFQTQLAKHDATAPLSGGHSSSRSLPNPSNARSLAALDSYGSQVMAATIINAAVDDQTFRASLPSSTIEDFSMTLLDSIPTPSPYKDAEGFIRPRGNPKALHQATQSAFREAASLGSDLEECRRLMSHIAIPSSIESIQLALGDVEHRIKADREDLAKITRKEASNAVNKVTNLLDVVEESLREWREKFPDESPLKIDNRTKFIT